MAAALLPTTWHAIPCLPHSAYAPPFPSYLWFLTCNSYYHGSGLHLPKGVVPALCSPAFSFNLFSCSSGLLLPSSMPCPLSCFWHGGWRAMPLWPCSSGKEGNIWFKHGAMGIKLQALENIARRRKETSIPAACGSCMTYPACATFSSMLLFYYTASAVAAAGLIGRWRALWQRRL